MNPKEIPTHLLSRITPPHLARVLDRSRLVDFIGNNIHHKIILILGQAALKGAILIALARGERKIGFGPGMEHQEHSYWFLNEKIPAVSMEIHALERNLMLLEAIGIPSPEIAYHIPIDEKSRQKADELIISGRCHSKQVPIAINPVAQWETKLWMPDRFSALADRLAHEHRACVFFTGGKADREMIDAIIGKNAHAGNQPGRKTPL